MYVCMSQTYIHTLSDFCVKSSLQRVWICSKTLCFVMKMKHTYMLKSLRNSNITVTHQEVSEAPEHVCLYVSLKPTKSACFGGCQIPHEKRSVFDHQFNFLRFVRGGYFQEPSEAPNMYVCMFELQTYPKHVCMSESPKQVCMYV